MNILRFHFLGLKTINWFLKNKKGNLIESLRFLSILAFAYNYNVFWKIGKPVVTLQRNFFLAGVEKSHFRASKIDQNFKNN